MLRTEQLRLQGKGSMRLASASICEVRFAAQRRVACVRGSRPRAGLRPGGRGDLEALFVFVPYPKRFQRTDDPEGVAR